MPGYGRYKVHPAADVFPLLNQEEFNGLVADIAEHGLLHPIILAPDEITIVDGRNRYLACIEALVDPGFTKLSDGYSEEQIIQLAISANLKRRDLTVGQRSMCALALEDLFAKAAWERKGRHSSTIDGSDVHNCAQSTAQGRAREQAGNAVGVTGQAVSKAKKIAATSPALADKVRRGDASLDDAYRQAVARGRSYSPDPPPLSSNVYISLPTHTGDMVRYQAPKSRPTFNSTNEHISWAAWSWNPVTGCLHGCTYCYARELANKQSFSATYPAGFTPLFHHERLSAPANTIVPGDVDSDPRRGRVFVCSMADLYGKWVPDEWISRVHKSCVDNPQWDYLMLTKFPRRYVGRDDLPKTAWLGTSVDEQKRVRLAEDAFRQIDDVRVKWLSLEPLREPLEFSDLSMFDWVVIGSQTQTEQPDGVVPAFAPPFDWVARIVAQAREAGCKVYLKPNLLGITGSQSPGMQLPQEEPAPKASAPIRAAELFSV